MKSILFIFLVFVLASTANAQSRDSLSHNNNSIRIVDTLTAKDLANRNPILSSRELDSLIEKIYIDKPQTADAGAIRQPEAAGSNLYPFIIGGLLLIIIALLYLFLRTQNKLSAELSRIAKNLKQDSQSDDESLAVHVNEHGELAVNGDKPEKMGGRQASATKTSTLIQQQAHEFELLKKKMSAVYKVKHYPGYSAQKSSASMMNVLDIERNIASHSYQQFVKPLLTIIDSNKNNPSKIRKAEQEQIVDLLVSLGLFHAEYLYLRVPELAVGGHIANRLEQLGKGATLDTQLLKPLNREHGSRALVLKVALEKMAIHELRYPVFDETHLNSNK